MEHEDYTNGSPPSGDNKGIESAARLWPPVVEAAYRTGMNAVDFQIIFCVNRTKSIMGEDKIGA